MPSRYIVTLLFAAVLAALPALARDNTPPPSGYPAVALLSTGTTVIGEPIVYPSGKAHVTAAVVTIAPGGKTIAHKHGVPMFAYMLARRTLGELWRGRHAHLQAGRRADGGDECRTCRHQQRRRAGAHPGGLHGRRRRTRGCHSREVA